MAKVTSILKNCCNTMRNVTIFMPTSLLFIFIIYSNGLIEEILRNDIFKIINKIPFNFSQFTFNNIKMNESDIAYFFYSRKFNNITFRAKYINPNYSLKVLIHGWTEHATVEWYTNVINAYLKRGYYNIIAVDWSSKGDADYLSASRYTRRIGQEIGTFLINLHKKKRIPFNNIHLLSHSLGAHVCGFIGKKIYESTGEKIGRITAMDPAAPLFDLTQDMRLSKENAKLVDVIHTDAGMLGFRYPIGTVDFFPNGGSAIQPGCSLLKADLNFDDFFCSHASSHRLFIKSIHQKKFYAKSCESYEQFSRGFCRNKKTIFFGEDTPMNATGSFYFQTKETDITV